MGYIHSVQIDNSIHLIEPLLFTTAGGTSTALTAAINNFVLIAGAYVNIKVNTVGDLATLNVNGTGAKSIFYNDVQISANMLTEGNIYTFIYDGVNWNILGDITGKNIMIGTTSEWQQHYNYIAPNGTILIYSDHGTLTQIINDQEVTKIVPGIKIADGSTPVIDTPFVGDDVIIPLKKELDDHIHDNIRHITADERNFWNHKIDCEDNVTANNLILKRN